MEDKKININLKEGTETLKVVYEPIQERKIHNWNPREYKLESLKAVVDLVKRKGSIGNTVVFYSIEKSRVIVVLDDSIQDRPLDISEYIFARSDDLKDWARLFGNRLSQKQLVDFLKQREDTEVPERENLILNIQKLKVITEIVGNYEFDDNGNISLMYKETNGKEGMMSLPNKFSICLPILNESDYKPVLDIELELIKPKAENEKPVIILSCPKLDRHIKNAIEYEISNLKTELKGYLLLSGLN